MKAYYYLFMLIVVILVSYASYKFLYKNESEPSEERLFPFRYFTDESNNELPIVAVTGFFRDEKAKRKYYEYKERGYHIFGITAYKTFPNKERLDESEGDYEKKDDFEYTKNIKDWLCCFRNKEEFGFTNFNHLLDMSESDFYNAEINTDVPKKYDFIYICCKDADDCPLNGWNAINRNFDLALKCFPAMIHDFKLKGLVIGRLGCGLEEKYGDRIEVVDFQPWEVLQEKMRESRMLFVPNIYDASPRVVAECLTKNVPVLMNRDILCGFKYIHHETGEFFTDEKNLIPALRGLLSRIDSISPKDWWRKHYSNETSYKKLRDFLAESFKDSKVLDNVKEVKFIL